MGDVKASRGPESQSAGLTPPKQMRMATVADVLRSKPADNREHPPFSEEPANLLVGDRIQKAHRLYRYRKHRYPAARYAVGQVYGSWPVTTCWSGRFGYQAQSASSSRLNPQAQSAGSIRRLNPQAQSAGSIRRLNPQAQSAGSIRRLNPQAQSAGSIRRLNPQAQSASSIRKLNPQAQAGRKEVGGRKSETRYQHVWVGGRPKRFEAILDDALHDEPLGNKEEVNSRVLKGVADSVKAAAYPTVVPVAEVLARLFQVERGRFGRRNDAVAVRNPRLAG